MPPPAPNTATLVDIMRVDAMVDAVVDVVVENKALRANVEAASILERDGGMTCKRYGRWVSSLV